MKLTIVERVNLASLLPKQSDFLTMKKVNELLDRLTLTDEEVKKYEVKVESGRILTSDEGKTYKADIEIGEIAEKEIVTTLKAKNDKRELANYEVPLYEKFVEKVFDGSGQEKVENKEQ